MSSVVTVSFDQLRAFIARGLERAGIPAADAQTVSGLMAQADMQGSDGHGVIRLPQYIKRIKAGGINTRPQMHLVQERAGTAVLHGDNGMGHLVVSKAVEIAIEKARNTGVAWVGTRYSNHAGPASLYASMPIQHDMLSLYFAVGNANHMPPWGGMDMLLSTNPIAAGIPTLSETPIVLDMATTVAAYGKVKAKAKRGEMMPEGWMIDRQGKPLLDPKRSEEGFLLPIGGHKGYGLALLVGMLAGTLGGAAMGKEVIDFNADHQTITNTGQAILVIDLKAFGDPAVFKQAADTLIRDLRASAKLPGVDRIWLPGEQSQLKRRRYAKEGIPIATGLLNDLNQLALDIGIAPLVDADAG
ncbi:MAG: Ldh family oxidoreductase [Burkholderiales bacterium]|nr:MAG: Ldh family oxidoreductase [Burkholderiales bacterium]